MSEDTIILGGDVGERVYFENLEFSMPDGKKVKIVKSFGLSEDMPNYFARHKARYYLSGLFCSPGRVVLDFPCGSGYGSKVLSDLGVIYEGREIDLPTMEYAKRVYSQYGTFAYGDLCKPELPENHYDVINCVEGIEHVDHEYQEPAVKAFYKALKKGGTLVISSPDATSGVSGQSATNPWHKWEMTKDDFIELLATTFPREEIELVTRKWTLPSGKVLNHFYCVCHKP
jgi:2-polyprenyl-3-methyl-5-hydroxy-6-metoxy-1,4-benzoquinol methylase